MSGRLVSQPTAQWRVREMTIADLDAVMQIEGQIYEFPWTPGNFRDAINSQYDAWIFTSEHRVIGYAVIMWLPDEVHLLNLSVAADRQGCGLGREILDWLVSDTRQRGAGSMLLEVRPSNDVARSLYASSGFEQIGLRKRYYPSHGPHREDALVLRKVFFNL